MEPDPHTTSMEGNQCEYGCQQPVQLSPRLLLRQFALYNGNQLFRRVITGHRSDVQKIAEEAKSAGISDRTIGI